MGKHHTRALAACHADIGIGGFARAVHHAPHHSDLKGTVHVAKAAFHFLGYGDKVYLAAPARGAADQLRVAATQAQRRKQRPAGTDLFNRIVGKGDAHGVAYALLQQDAQPAGGFDKALEQRARLGKLRSDIADKLSAAKHKYRRIIKAFPDIRSNDYQEALDHLKDKGEENK